MQIHQEALQLQQNLPGRRTRCNKVLNQCCNKQQQIYCSVPERRKKVATKFLDVMVYCTLKLKAKIKNHTKDF
jgi:hypothetical protein